MERTREAVAVFAQPASCQPNCPAEKSSSLSLSHTSTNDVSSSLRTLLSRLGFGSSPRRDEPPSPFPRRSKFRTTRPPLQHHPRLRLPYRSRRASARNGRPHSRRSALGRGAFKEAGGVRGGRRARQGLSQGAGNWVSLSPGLGERWESAGRKDRHESVESFLRW